MDLPIQVVDGPPVLMVNLTIFYPKILVASPAKFYIGYLSITRRNIKTENVKEEENE